MTPRLQLTSLLRRLGLGGPAASIAARASGSPGTGGTAVAGASTQGASTRGTATATAAPGVRGVPAASSDLEVLIARARAAGAPADAVEAFATRWRTLEARARAQVARPLVPAAGTDVLRWGTAAARQTDRTTCGSAVLAMLAAAGDPLLGLWLATGETCAGFVPAEVRGTAPELDAVAAPSGIAPDPDAGAAARFGAVQHAVKHQSVSGALLGLRWPAALGTPPWGAARVARFPGVGYRSLLVDDSRASEITAILERAGRALDRGVPVPLYTGGDLSTGIGTAVPRHVVLLTARTGDHLTVYEPSQGRIHQVTTEDLVQPGGPSAALGGWTHVCWAVLPVATAAATRGAGRSPDTVAA